MTLVARGHGTPAALLASVKQAVWQGDPQAAVFEAATLDEVLDRQVWREQVASNLVGGFALVALVLATLGIHGIVSHGVSTRVREFGVRVALGASPSSCRVWRCGRPCCRWPRAWRAASRSRSPLAG